MKTKHQGIPVIGFIGFSGSGKTTILTQVIDRFKQKGKKIAVIKHTHHHFDIDKKGKDSYRFREAGANQVIVGSKNRFALMVETQQEEPDLTFLLRKLDCADLDLILFEGFKHEDYPKIEVHRLEMNKPWLFNNDCSIIALVTDDNLVSSTIPIFELSDIDKIVAFLVKSSTT